MKCMKSRLLRFGSRVIVLYIYIVTLRGQTSILIILYKRMLRY